MPQIEDDFGSEVFGGSAQGVRSHFDCFGEAEVGELEVAIFCDQQILGFQVSEYYVLVVKVFEYKHDLCCIEPTISQTSTQPASSKT